MTKQEFLGPFMDAFGACYPMIQKWLIDQEDNVRDEWHSNLKNVSVTRASDLVRLWFRDRRHPWKDTSDWQYIPVYVRQALTNVESEAQQADRLAKIRKEKDNYQRPPEHVSMDETLKEMQKLPREQWKSFVAEKFPI